MKKSKDNTEARDASDLFAELKEVILSGLASVLIFTSAKRKPNGQGLHRMPHGSAPQRRSFPTIRLSGTVSSGGFRQATTEQ